MMWIGWYHSIMRVCNSGGGGGSGSSSSSSV